MTRIKAVYYDGDGATGHEVTLYLQPGGAVAIAGLPDSRQFSGDALRFSDRLANTPRFLYLPDGAKCEIADNDAIDAFVAAYRSNRTTRFAALIHHLERHWAAVLAAVGMTALFVWLAIDRGIPAAASAAVDLVPLSVDIGMGEQTLAFFDERLFEPSALPPSRQQELRNHFKQVAAPLAVDERDARLEFRKSKVVGANAFALPDGTILVTDELVALARSDAELIAVLAHEVGHLVHRHSLRGLLQGTGAAAVMVLVTGDVSSVASLAAALPVLLVESSYSRAFEREADTYAAAYLDGAGIDRAHFVTILKRMTDGEDPPGVVGYLSSHPVTDERIEALRTGPRSQPR